MLICSLCYWYFWFLLYLHPPQVSLSRAPFLSLIKKKRLKVSFCVFGERWPVGTNQRRPELQSPPTGLRFLIKCGLTCAELKLTELKFRSFSGGGGVSTRGVPEYRCGITEAPRALAPDALSVYWWIPRREAIIRAHTHGGRAALRGRPDAMEPPSLRRFPSAGTERRAQQPTART